MPLIYVAQPIDQAGPRDARTLQFDQTVETLRCDHTIYRPARAWAVAPEIDPRVQQTNNHVLDQADLVVAHLPSGVPTIGVPMEVERATGRGIPAVVITDTLSFALAGNPLVTAIGYDPELAAKAVNTALHDHPSHRYLWPATQPTLRVVLRDGATPPAPAYTDDAGIDLVCDATAAIPPGQLVDIPTTVVGVQTPPDMWAMVVQRSSTLRKRGLHIPTSVIDPGWRGPLLVGAYNLGTEPVQVNPGDRLAQIVLITNATAQVRIQPTDTLDPHPRGLNGFGSTGAGTPTR